MGERQAARIRSSNQGKTGSGLDLGSASRAASASDPRRDHSKRTSWAGGRTRHGGFRASAGPITPGEWYLRPPAVSWGGAGPLGPRRRRSASRPGPARGSSLAAAALRSSGGGAAGHAERGPGAEDAGAAARAAQGRFVQPYREARNSSQGSGEGGSTWPVSAWSAPCAAWLTVSCSSSRSSVSSSGWLENPS